jgi:hypothetical protein
MRLPAPAIPTTTGHPDDDPWNRATDCPAYVQEGGRDTGCETSIDNPTPVG